MLDSTIQAEIEHGLRQDALERRAEIYERRAREAVAGMLFRDQAPLNQPCIDTLLERFLDDPLEAINGDWAAFRKACADRRTSEIGRLLEAALDRLADDYMESGDGLDLVNEQMRDMETDNEY